MRHREVEDQLPVPGLIFQDRGQPELPRQGEVPVHTGLERQQEDQ